MTAHDADAGALTDRYRDLVEVGRGGETVRYSGRLLDGSHVTVWVVARALSSRIVAPDRLTQTGVATMEGVGLHAAFVAGGLTRREAAVALSPAPYLSSELQGGGEPDGRSDIYSLGASLYELLTGKPPFGGRTTSFVMATVLAAAETPVPGITAAADQPNPVVDAILRAIEHAPEDRWGTADAFASALESDRPRPSSEVRSSSWGAILKRAWFPARRSRE